MTSERGQEFGFAPAHDAPIPYMQRIRDYYVALGYGAPYDWAHYAEVPFQPLKKPLAQSRVTHRHHGGALSARQGRSGARGAVQLGGEVLPGLLRRHRRRTTICASRMSAIDRKHTTAEDPGTWFPLPELRRAAARGRIGAVAPRFHGLPTNRSHRVTLEVDCPELVARCKADGVDAALLGRQLPGLPPEHQPGRARAGGQRHPHRGDGLRQGHRRARRRAALPVLRFPARQCRRPAEGPAVAGLHARAGAAGAGDRARRAHHRAVAASLERAAPTGSSTSTTSRSMSPEEIARRRAEFDKQKEVATKLREDLGLQRDKAKASAA